MIKILVISASPVEDSSTDILLNTIANSLKNSLPQDKDAGISFIKLNELQIKPCQACGESPSPKFCFYDEIDDVYKQIAECDYMLFGSPVYFDSVSAQAKLLIDRCNCFRPPDYKNSSDFDFLKILKKKRPGAMVIVGGEQTWYEGTRRVIAGFFKWIEVVNNGMIQYSSTDYNIKGSVKENVEIINEAKQLGKFLATKWGDFDA